MKKKSTLYYDDEVDLIDLIRLFWNGKIKILLITTFSFLVGFGYSYQVQNTYLISLDINQNYNFDSKNINFIRQLLIKNEIINDKDNFFTKSILLNKFNNEIQDYEEFLLNLKKTKKVKENISKLPLEIQKKELLKYVDLFKINKSDLKLNFEWNNIDEAKNILQDTINLTLNNLEKSIYKELDIILENRKKLDLSKDLIRLDYLKKQRWIAKELYISKPTYGYTGEPYYLRGYEAIDKEIELLEKRDYKKYKFIKQNINSLKKENFDWANNDVNLIEVKSLKNTQLILILSIFLGLIVGIFYVLIFNEIKSQINSKKKDK